METRARTQRHQARSLCRAHRIAGQDDRPEHARRRRVSGETEVTRTSLAIAVVTLSVAALVSGQGRLDPTKLGQPPTDAWPSYHGDYSGRRYSTLTQINSDNVKNLQLAWLYRLNTSRALANIGGEGPETAPAVSNAAGITTIKSTPLMVNGVEYFSTSAPIIVGKHVLIGVGGDSLDVPAYLESRSPESGELIWRWYTTPRAGQAGAETWPNAEAMLNGGGMPWLPGTYDPELNLYYIGTGNPQPVLAGKSREGDNLWTCSIVALNPDTGKLAWYYQVSPHDTHDWDAAQTPVLIDGVIDGRPRKLLAQANRNGHFVLLDRTNGEHLLTTRLIDSANWTKEINAKGQPIRNPAKDANVPGTLVSPDTSGATNWPPPSFDPDTGLFYVGTRQTFSVLYLTDTDERPQGWAAAERNVGNVGSALKAIDLRTGKVKWSHPLATGPAGSVGGAMGLLSTAGGLLF